VVELLAAARVEASEDELAVRAGFSPVAAQARVSHQDVSEV